MAMARMIGAGISSGERPPATRTAIAASRTWKTSSGTSGTVCVAYSGAAAIMVRIRSSISRRFSFIGNSYGKDNRISIDGLGYRLVCGFEQGQGAEDRRRRLSPLSTHQDARQREYDVEIAAQGVVDERRRRADHPFELFLAHSARAIWIDDDLHGASGFQLCLFHDPSAEARRFLPVHLAERIAPHVFAKRVDVGARSQPAAR